ncbi:MAG: ester cyclase [Synergistales bacterium]|nr:ester cyclase [Synergistales bacterium]MDY6405080.1 ester cyclase [Synergistales bacterium]MDY6410768.1 ester cyclase [Synergistales bacterium]MDY6414035.1 ester cyclase [Synergistales bacterium]MDY6423096.1 ester cyclase [Synergistales bacterium]
MNIIERNRKNIDRFRICINTNDKKLAEELIDERAEFASLISDEKLYGGTGYLSVVEIMRRSFSDIHWEIADVVVDENKAAVSWICSGTHDGMFMNFPATGKKFSFICMNFYYFNAEGKIIKDVAAQGIMGLLQSLSLLPK